MNWIKKTPESLAKLKDTDYVLMVSLHKGMIIENRYSDYGSMKAFRKYDLENEYTHFIKIAKPK